MRISTNIFCFKSAAAGLVFLFIMVMRLNTANAEAPDVVVGKVRVQLLSDSLVRLEVKGPEGFENRLTFHVVNRNWPGTPFTTNESAGAVEIRTANYLVHVPENASSLDGVRVESADGQTLYTYDGKLENSRWLPAPADKPQVWWFADTPRIVPPPWGLTPAPPGAKRPQTSGWDLSNNAPDVYVFVPLAPRSKAHVSVSGAAAQEYSTGQGNYFTLQKDFLKLTGPTEMPPLFAFGAWDSRWYNYSEATALAQIEAYRAHKIPLDVLVVDTGWRQGASTGYQPNTNLFPNLPRFFREAHARHVRVMFNDHPEPVAKTALSPRELSFRYAGLSGLLNDGLDIWWYDRNWSVHLHTPATNLDKEVWGMRLYHDITARVRPVRRPLIMANVDGIDNGIRHRPMDAAAHRFPIQWTGDIGPGYDYLRRAVENAVYSGVKSLFPYESDDLGGHTADPTTNQYIRWIEYGALSPIYRPHCTYNHERMPWVFGPEAERVARRFLDMRYRLLPVFYAAAHENYETGAPLLRRLDLYYPQFPEARRDDEYLLGKYILVAPTLPKPPQTVPVRWLKTPDGQSGLQAAYFANDNLSGAPAFTRTDAAIDFNWDEQSPKPGIPRTHFSARWTGTIEVPASVGNVVLGTLADDGTRVWIDGRLVIDDWRQQAPTATEASAVLTAGVPHQIRVEYMQLIGGATVKLQWHPVRSSTAARAAWIPPGDWIDAWSGKVVSGPAMVTNEVPLDEISLWIKSGTVLPLAPQMQYTSEKPWNPIMLDVYPRGGRTNTATLYEDDTLTTAYQQGEFRTTEIAVSADSADKTVTVTINAAKGNFHDALEERAWTLRVHPPADWPNNLTSVAVKINGQENNVPSRRLARAATAMPFGDETGAPDAAVCEVSLPTAPVSQNQLVEIAFAPPH